MWPFRKKETEKTLAAPAAEPEPTRNEWETLPALPVVLEPLQLTLDTENFEPGLSTRRDPDLFLAPLEHEVSDEAASGLVEGLITVASRHEDKREPALPPAPPLPTPMKEPQTLETGASDRERVPPRPIHDDPTRSVSVAEVPVVSPAPPVPKMISATESQYPLPRLDLRPPKPEALEPDPVAPGPSEPRETAGRPERAESDRSRPTVGRPEEPSPRRPGLGEPMSHKPATQSSLPGEMKPPSPAPEAAPPVTPRAEPELVLPPPQPEPRDLEFDRVPNPPEVRSQPAEVDTPQVATRPQSPTPDDARPETPRPQSPTPDDARPETPRPQSPTPDDIRPETPRPAMAPSDVGRPPKPPRFTPPVRKPEVRPTLASRPPAVQRQIAEGSPHPRSGQIPQTFVSVRHSPPPADTPSVGSDIPHTPRPSPSPTRPTQLRSEPAPLVPIKRAVVDETSTELPVSTALIEAMPQKTEVDMPVAKRAEPEPTPTYRPQFPSDPAKPKVSVAKEPPPAAASPSTTAEIPLTPEPAVSIQRAPASPAPVAADQKKDETDAEADAIYEKVRTRLRKELRMYREQAGRHTYGG